MKIAIQNNIKRRKYYNAKEEQIKYLNWIKFNVHSRTLTPLISKTDKSLFNKINHKINIVLMHQKADCSISKIKNTCYISRRSRGVSRVFRLSRISFKEEMQKEYMTGVTRFPVR